MTTIANRTAISPPPSIWIFAALEVTAFSVGALFALSGVKAPDLGEHIYTTSGIIGYLMKNAPYVLLVWTVVQFRKNWARWVLLGLQVLTVPFACWIVMQSLEYPWFALSIALPTVLGLVAQWFTFRSDAQAWFEQTSTE
jgi:hypothetical protein